MDSSMFYPCGIHSAPSQGLGDSKLHGPGALAARHISDRRSFGKTCLKNAGWTIIQGG